MKICIDGALTNLRNVRQWLFQLSYKGQQLRKLNQIDYWFLLFLRGYETYFKSIIFSINQFWECYVVRGYLQLCSNTCVIMKNYNNIFIHDGNYGTLVNSLYCAFFDYCCISLKALFCIYHVYIGARRQEQAKSVATSAFLIVWKV